VADESSLAVEDRDFERDLGAREHARCRLPCRGYRASTWRNHGDGG